MIENLQLYKVRELCANVEVLSEEVQERLKSTRVEEMISEVKVIAVELDTVLKTNGVVKENLERVIEKRLDRKFALKNALRELERCIKLVELKASEERAVNNDVSEAEEKIIYALTDIKTQLHIARLVSSLSNSRVKKLEDIKEVLRLTSKQVDRLLDSNSRKLSRKIDRRLRYILTTEDICEEEEICLEESLTECFELIECTIEDFLKQYQSEV